MASERAESPMSKASGPSSGVPGSAGLGGPVVLKKYGNRRLYDTSASRYVTLTEVEDMVQRGTDVQVLDAKTGDDLTKEILVQIILDTENAREVLPTSFLKQVVRLSASPLKESFTRTLQDSLETFLSSQRSLVEAQRAMLAQLQPFGGAGGAGPASMPGLSALHGLWNPFQAFATPPVHTHTHAHAHPSVAHAAPAPAPAAAPAPARDPEMDRLRAEVSETQALLRQLLEQGADKADKKGKPRAKKRAGR